MESSESQIARARNLVLAHGWNATSYQIVNPGFDLWFSEQATAVIGSMKSGRTRVVAGAPVCSEKDLAATIDRFEAKCLDAKERVCYFGAAGRVYGLLHHRRGYAAVTLGAQPVWAPQHWVRLTYRDSSLRAQYHRAMNKGVRVMEWTAEKATGHPELVRVLNEWLDTRGLPPLHFLIEPETLGRLEGRRVFVAEREGRPVGFTVLSPVPKRNGWLTEQFPRGKDAPNGTVELMIDQAARALANEGSEYLTMGLVPLADHGVGKDATNPLWLSVLARWTRAHGRRFYNFDGLDRFKNKLHPEHWEAIYAVSNEPRFSFKTLHAIAAVFAGGSPEKAVAIGLGRALRQELRWLRNRRRGGAHFDVPRMYGRKT